LLDQSPYLRGLWTGSEYDFSGYFFSLFRDL
jgi:hypothetical protein